MQYKRTCEIKYEYDPASTNQAYEELISAFQNKKDLFPMLELADTNILTEIDAIRQDFNFDDFRLELICDHKGTHYPYIEMQFDFKIIFNKEISLLKYL
jgi:hypothetical protein